MSDSIGLSLSRPPPPLISLRASVRLGVNEGVVTFEVRDDGPGFAPNATTGGMGTDIMRDRIDALEGELRIDSRPGEATTVTGRVPARALEAAS